MLKINCPEAQLKTLRQQLQLIRTNAVERKRLHQVMGRKVITAGRARIRKQQDLDGAKFKARKYHSRKRLLRKLMKGNSIKAFVGPNKATVTWPNNRTGSIARGHQEGFSERFTKKDAKRGQPDYEGPPSDAQAKALMKEGFKRYVGRYGSGKKKGQAKKRRVSKAWIKDNMTLGQAGLVLRMMREGTNDPNQLTPSPSAWVVEVPERPFFGLNRNEVIELRDDLIEDKLHKIKGKR